MGFLEKSSGFLPDSEAKRTRYNRFKPVVILILVMFLVFNVIGCLIQGLAIGYAEWAYQPVQIDLGKYNEAQKLNSELSQRFARLKLARPKDVNVIVALAAVTSAKPKEVDLTGINITPDKTVITGIAKSLDLANQYCNSITITGKKSLLNTVKTDKEGISAAAKDSSDSGNIKFTISIVENIKDAGKGGGKK